VIADEAAAAAALAVLATKVARLRQGPALMLETQATHAAMLRSLMEAAATPEESETALFDAPAKIAGILGRQTGVLEAIPAGGAFWCRQIELPGV
jgi:hypothetical protein